MRIICLVWCRFQVLEIQFEFGVESPAAFWGLGYGGLEPAFSLRKKQIPTQTQTQIQTQKNKLTQTQTQIQTQIQTQTQTDSNPDSNSLLLSPDLFFPSVQPSAT